LRALLRRRAVSQPVQLLHLGIRLNQDTWTATYKDSELTLSRRELMLLRVLIENAGRVVTKTALTEQLYNWDDDIGSNTLEVFVHGIRKQTQKSLIKTVRGVGYMLVNEVSQP